MRKINHIGIAVKSISAVFDFYEEILGLEFQGYEEVKEQGVRVAFFKLGESRIELLEPLNNDSPIAKFIEKKGEGIHHLAINSKNLIKDLNDFEKNNIKLIDREPRKGAHNTQIAFVHPKATNGILLELTQE
jgi:methylmalonyl-CoA epimerase